MSGGAREKDKCTTDRQAGKKLRVLESLVFEGGKDRGIHSRHGPEDGSAAYVILFRRIKVCLFENFGNCVLCFINSPFFF